MCQITARVRQIYPNATHPYTVIEFCASMTPNNGLKTIPCAGVSVMPSISEFQYARIIYTPQGLTTMPVIAYAYVNDSRLDIVQYNCSWYVIQVNFLQKSTSDIIILYIY